MALACSFSTPVSHELSSAGQSTTVRKLRISLSKCYLSRNPNQNLLIRAQIRAIKSDPVASDQVRQKSAINGENSLERDVHGNENGAVVNTITTDTGSRCSGNGLTESRFNENGELGVSRPCESSRSLLEHVKDDTSVDEEDIPPLKVESETIFKAEEAEREEKESSGGSMVQEDPEGKIKFSAAPGGRWSRFETYSTIERTMEIWGHVLVFVFKAWLNNQKFSYLGGMTEKKIVIRRKALAKWLKESILRLGPTFIKIGQQFSTRVDLLDQEFVDQLSELQDQVPPFPSEVAVSIIEEELGAPIADIFQQFDNEPIAAASLGQVHRAKLKGQDVVVKVQRPALKALFDIDLKNLKVIAGYLQKIDPKSDGAKRDWVAIYDECASVLYQEIDYTKEAANAELFASNFQRMDYVKVPTIYWEYTTPQVLTMEYVPGIKISKVDALEELGVDRKRLARYVVESFLEQILCHGFFHADPHPGNIAVDDMNGGRLIFYDFGMMGSITPNIREGLLEAFYGIYEKDPEKVLDAMVQMGVLVPTGDMTSVRRTAQYFLNSLEERLAAQEKERATAGVELGSKKPSSTNWREEMKKKKKQRLAAIGEDLLAIAADQPFRFPATFAFVARAFSVLDGIGKGLDPRFDITEIAKPYALELLRFREAGVELILKDLRKRWDRQARAFYNLFRQADRIEKLAQVVERLEKGDLKLRVRSLESERAFQRVAAVQKTIGNAVAVGSLVNLATILYLHSFRVPAIAVCAICTFFALQVLFSIRKVKRLDETERLIIGTA